MKILFTKKIDTEMISQHLGDHFSYDFAEVIATKTLKVNSFDVGQNSLIFTSLNGVKAFFENSFRITGQKIYCVGKTSEIFLKERGFSVSRTEKNAEDLAAFLLKNAEHENLLHFAGNISMEILGKELRKSGRKYQKVIVYETELLFPKIEKKYDAIVFFSPSGVRSFAKFNSFGHSSLFSIGETTEKEMRKYTENNIDTSVANDVKGVLEMIKSTAPKG